MEHTPASHAPLSASESVYYVTSGLLRYQGWVKALTILSGVFAAWHLITLNIVALVFSGMTLYACIAAWKAIDVFHSARSEVDLQEGLSNLVEYFRWQAIAVGISAALIALIVLLLLLLIFAIVVLGLAL